MSPIICAAVYGRINGQLPFPARSLPKAALQKRASGTGVEEKVVQVAGQAAIMQYPVFVAPRFTYHLVHVDLHRLP